MKSILITGANRGLGLGLVKQLAKDVKSPKYIIGTCRNIEKAKDLQEVRTQHSNVHILELDIRNTDSFPHFTEEVKNILCVDGLNVLFNNAGCASKSTRINLVKTEQFTEVFQTNLIGPVMLTKALLPLLKKAASNSPKQYCIEGGAIINMSSILGSITLNDIGGMYPYRCSKAALNMATKTLSIDLKSDGILVTSIHPGWVKTDLGGQGAPMQVNDSISQIIDLMKNLNESHNGGFYQYDGKKLEW
ncbi:hypothetical protein HHI36_007529 [Cryptolaemus montrouzieri]|uniref:C-factor n=1 Tax=Cryptolaemus montrouzieri TaxID=559131 RepID=A0ABD2MPV1_9CUCU